MAADPTGTERRRRSRERERLGIHLVTVTLEPKHIASLADWGLIDRDNTCDRARLTVAVELLIGGLAAGAVKIDFDAFVAYIQAHTAKPATASPFSF